MASPQGTAAACFFTRGAPPPPAGDQVGGHWVDVITTVNGARLTLPELSLSAYHTLGGP